MTTTPFGMAIAATGGYAPDYPAVEAGIERLRKQGYLIHNYYQHEQRHQRFAGTDEARLAQLYAAAEDPEVQVVLALRGSYGMSRLLPHIDFDRLAASGKLFVGYSDFTAFQMAYMKQTGCVSFAGPMFCGDYARDTLVGYTMQQFQNCLQGPLHHVSGEVAAEGSDNPVVEVRGQLWGGNLAMLVSLLGTPYFAAQPGGILFLEDISEHPYRIERMVLQLFYAGALEGQQALVLGDFSGYKLSLYDNGYDFEAMLAYLRSVLPLPVLTGLPFGHIERRATLPYGAMAHLSSEARTLELTLSEYPTLRG